MKYITTVNNQTFVIEVNREGEVIVDGEARTVDFRGLEGKQAIYSLLLNNKSYEAVVEERDGQYHVLMAGDLYEVEVTDERLQRLAEAAGGSAGAGGTGELLIRSPMPGMIVAVPVIEGQEISKGETLVILESMKMENELKAPRDGVVSRIYVKTGDSVEQNKGLVVLMS